MKDESHNTSITIVGVGASAGGLEALQEFISHLPTDLNGLAIVVAQHLSPTHKSMLVQLLGRQTSLEVVEIKHNMGIAPNKIYITPPDSELSVTLTSTFSLAKPKTSPGPKPSVDVFFKSLSKAKGSEAIGIILSGTGSDGAQGIRSIKEANGVTIAQEPQTAKYNGMPLSAIETGYVDMVLSPDKIGEELKDLMSYPALKNTPNDHEADGDSVIKRLFFLLSKRSGTDFSNYKPSTIYRRLEKRIVELKLKDKAHYLDYVEQEPSELDQLFQKILISVTSFFRDPDLFAKLEKRLEKMVAKKKPNDQIRIWIPGCATGEEAYSIALLLIKILRNRASNYDIQIFATDIDEKAINYARAGLYPKKSLEYVPEDILNNYVLKKRDGYEIIKSVRQMILFSKHDVTSNPPFLKLDLISCRNLLIYFGQSLQHHVIPIFHYALNPDGYLFLGKSETVGQFNDLFDTEDGKSKLFKRRSDTHPRAIRFGSFKPKKLYSQEEAMASRPKLEATIAELVRETFYKDFEHAYVVVNTNMDIIEVSGDVRMYLNINPGAMNANVVKLCDKNLQISLRSVLMKAIKEGKPQNGQVKRVNYFDREAFVRIMIRPLVPAKPEDLLFCVIFETFDFEDSIMGVFTTTDDNAGENPRIIELEHELASTKEHLQTFVEELETANEELQSLNEELQSSNEELQSSNEELETSNEELQSTNEELQIAYAELKEATKQVDRQSKLLQSSEANAKALLNNTLQAFMLIGQDYRLVSFNKTAQKYMEEVFGRKPKVGDSIIDFQVQGSLEQFHKDLNRAMKGDSITGEKEIKIGPDEYKWYRYNYTPVKNDESETEVVSYSQLDITEQKLVEISLAENERLISSIFNAADVGICVTDEKGCFIKVNQVYCEMYGYKMKELIGQPFTIVLPKDKRKSRSEMHQRYLDGHPESAGIWHVMRKDGEIMEVRVTAARLISERNKRFKVTTVAPVYEKTN